MAPQLHERPVSWVRRCAGGQFMCVGCACAPYVRELSEVGGVDVEPVRQPLHQVQALVAGEGAGSGRDTTQKQVGVRLTHTAMWKCCHLYFVRFFFSLSLF